MALSTEQLLLLNNLMYMDSGPLQNVFQFEGQTVGEWLQNIDMTQLDPSADYSTFTDGQEWANIIEAVRQDSTLMDMRIASTHVDNAAGGGDGQSAVFISESTGEAAVVFKGTQGSAEWSDNFIGGSGLATPQQQNALDWYESVYEELSLEQYEITISGHSKGGNKAKFITVLNDTVDHCVSFDGQGFSDEFITHYADEIARRQGIIENHNIDYDYVNILLNDIGSRTYYEGYNIGEGSFIENHCPNTFLRFNEDGSFDMVVSPEGQGPEMQALDEFLNSYLRSLPEEERAAALLTFGELAATLTSMDSGGTMTDVINTLAQFAANQQHADSFSYLLAYLIEYEQANPEFAEQINQVLREFGLEDATQVVDIVDAILNLNVNTPFGTITFDGIADFLSELAGDIPTWLLSLLRDVLLDNGIDLSVEEIRTILEIIPSINENMDTITVTNNGGDLRVGTAAEFTVDTSGLRQAADRMSQVVQQLHSIANTVSGEAGRYNQVFSGAQRVVSSMLGIGSDTETLGLQASQLASALRQIAEIYDRTENTIISNTQ